MKGSALLPVLVAGVIPFLVLELIVTGSGLGLVQWRPPTIWTDQFGTTGTNPNGITGIAVSSASVYAGGYLNATDYFTGVPFVRSYDFGGRVVWSTDITRMQGFTIVSVAVGSNGVFALGEAVTNTTLWKFDLNGNELWARELKGVFDSSVYSTTNNVYLAEARVIP